jgi:hypothetical protein
LRGLRHGIQEGRIGGILGQEMHVHGKGEGGRMVPGPVLNLLGVRAMPEQHRLGMGAIVSTAWQAVEHSDVLGDSSRSVFRGRAAGMQNTTCKWCRFRRRALTPMGVAGAATGC